MLPLLIDRYYDYNVPVCNVCGRRKLRVFKMWGE
jgi:hypothetical protein